MQKALEATQQHFHTSSDRTKQYLDWHALLKKQFTEYLKTKGATAIKIGLPNHFDINGFFQRPAGHTYYFSIGDVRGNKTEMLLRTAKHNKDYTGGSNRFVTINQGLARFDSEFDALTR